MSHFIISPSGRLIDVMAPKPDDFNIEDIAAGLVTGKCERYGSRTKVRYYVAEHSVHVANLFAAWAHLGWTGFDDMQNEEIAKACLLHDAAEAYLGDIVQPLKSCLPDYKALERSFEDAICVHFGLSVGIFNHIEVKQADHQTFRCELVNVAIDSPEHFAIDSAVNEVNAGRSFECAPSLRYMGWNATVAKSEFLKLAKTLGIK